MNFRLAQGPFCSCLKPVSVKVLAPLLVQTPNVSNGRHCRDNLECGDLMVGMVSIPRRTRDVEGTPGGPLCVLEHVPASWPKGTGQTEPSIRSSSGQYVF